MMRGAELFAAIDAWRAHYESHSATQYEIAAAIGCSQSQVSRHARKNGWLLNKRKCSARTRARDSFASTSAPMPSPAAVATPSVWALAAGVRVSTIRHDGKHVEVAA